MDSKPEVLLMQKVLFEVFYLLDNTDYSFFRSRCITRKFIIRHRMKLLNKSHTLK